ncbi:NACHT domain-containing protein [Pasteurella multocida]|uniref:NACHT domain-containing protein n=1 Tax=Pasteurella multocida TaxID=747 RepID=UPI0035A85948
MELDRIVSIGECGYVEYKRQWYWELDYQPNNDELQRLWGEFIKDFLSLTNANSASFGYTRFLVIGFDEKEKKYYDFSLNEKYFKELRNKIHSKIKKFISESSKIKYKISHEIKDGISIILIYIEQPIEIHSLCKEIQTKTLKYPINSTLGRGESSNDKNDRVVIISPEQIQELANKLSPVSNKTFNKRRRSIRATIDSYLERNSSFSLSDDFPKLSNESERYYEFYEVSHNISPHKIYFLYISENSMESTLKNFSDTFSKFLDKEISILIDKPSGTTQPEKRKNNLEKYAKSAKLKNIQVYFIDEFGKKFLYKEYLEPFLFKDGFNNTKNFIDNNVIDNSNKNSSLKAYQVISNWFKEEDSPIIVLTGIGGVGKTTLTKYFLNKNLKKQNQENYILFLDSSTLIDKLKATTVNNIYDLYKADLNEQAPFTEQLFKLSIDNGSFIIVLDGLDEIISRMKENFQLHHFLHKICTDYCFNSAKTKIIITCRDSIWEESTSQCNQIKNLAIRHIFLEPFNEEQAKEFFKMAFKDNNSLQKKAFSLVEKLIGESNDKIYNPFILDTVKSIITDKNNSEIDYLFLNDKPNMASLCLSTQSQTDYLIYSVCKRESKKLGIPLSNQIKLLCHMCKYDGLSNCEFMKLVQDVLKKDTNDQELSLLKAHPFIGENNKRLNLRYDFLRDFFTVLLIAQMITDDNLKLDESIFLLLDKKVSYLNTFSKEVAKRTLNSNIDDICLNIINNIEEISLQKKDNFERFISSLFLIYLGILKEFNKLNNKDDLMAAMNSIFCTSNKKIKNFCLYNINKPNGKPKLVFDFSDMKFENFHIENYSEFYNCTFNENTFFESGKIDLAEAPDIRHGLKKSNFSNMVTFLGKTESILNTIEEQSDLKEKKKEDSFVKFVKKFLVRGIFKSKKVSEIRAKQGELVDKMLELEVIVLDRESKLNDDEYKINPKLEDEVTKYLDSSVPSPKIIEILNKM